ncbi:vomeronasal 1 receptor bosTauV1R403 [Camelus ferus]|nr:vomeronasal 1 receptor bosTauV1R403 [Camelus ferus]
METAVDEVTHWEQKSCCTIPDIQPLPISPSLTKIPHFVEKPTAFAKDSVTLNLEKRGSFLIQSPLKKPIDLIFIHLTFVNILTIMFKLIPDLMSSFGVRHFLDDVGCKVTLFVYRVTRGLSICTTALLSAFQAITISPSQSNWVRLKSKFSTCIYPSFFFFWIINTLIYVDITKILRANHNFTIAPSGYSQIYCQSKQMEQHHLMAFLSVILIRDLLCVVFMMLSSIYMVNLLYKHHQRAQHVHSPNVSSQPAPEIKASHTILLLTKSKTGENDWDNSILLPNHLPICADEE